jgi:hypothetical protein
VQPLGHPVHEQIGDREFAEIPAGEGFVFLPQPLGHFKSDPVSLDTVWTTMTAAKEAGHEGQGAKANHDSGQ